MSDGYKSGLNGTWNITERAWYDAIMESNGVAISEPYVDASTQESVITVAAPIQNGGQIVGAVGVDILVDKITPLITALEMGETGYFTVVTKGNTVLYHRNPDYIMKSVEDLPVEQVAKDMLLYNTTAVNDYVVNGNRIHGYNAPIGETGWKVVSSLPDDEYAEPFLKVQTILIIMCTLVMLISCAIIIIASKNVVKPLRKLADIADRISEGDLDVEIDVKTSDETGMVATSFEKTVVRLKGYIEYINEISDLLKDIGQGKLHLDFKQAYDGEFAIVKEALIGTTEMLSDTLTQISLASEQVASGSDQVSGGAQALSQGATEQASSIEELSATMNDISSQIKLTAENATKARDIAQSAAVTTSTGQEQMQHMVEAMEEITRTSNEIGKIIKNIDDIAFQTNILALNAAVEAARAGSAGKGFAVVADEVRNLASKSAESAKNTSALIESALDAINKGTQIVHQTATSLEEIVQGAGQTGEIIQHIADASVEQAEAITQVNMGVEQIASVVQTNSATAEEQAAASEELSAQAQMLKELLARFSLKADKGSRNNYREHVQVSQYNDYDFEESNDLKY
ncbi:MAG: methyl-accepting chemotaxis protein [Anaerotignum sp.]